MHACVDTTAPTASTSRSHADVADVNCTRYLVNLPIRNVSPINWIRPRCNRLHFHFNLGLPAIYQSWGCSNCSACPYQLFRSSKALLLRFYRLFPVCLGGLIWFIPRSFRIHLRSAKILSALALFPDFEASICWFLKNIHHSFKNPQACLNKQRNFQSQRIRNNFEECSNQIKPADLFFLKKISKKAGNQKPESKYHTASYHVLIFNVRSYYLWCCFPDLAIRELWLQNDQGFDFNSVIANVIGWRAFPLSSLVWSNGLLGYFDCYISSRIINGFPCRMGLFSLMVTITLIFVFHVQITKIWLFKQLFYISISMYFP